MPPAATTRRISPTAPTRSGKNISAIWQTASATSNSSSGNGSAAHVARAEVDVGATRRATVEHCLVDVYADDSASGSDERDGGPRNDARPAGDVEDGLSRPRAGCLEEARRPLGEHPRNERRLVAFGGFDRDLEGFVFCGHARSLRQVGLTSIGQVTYLLACTAYAAASAAIAQAELRKDTAHVVGGGLARDVQTRGDFRVAEAGAEQREHFSLACRERAQALGADARNDTESAEERRGAVSVDPSAERFERGQSPAGVLHRGVVIVGAHCPSKIGARARRFERKVELAPHRHGSLEIVLGGLVAPLSKGNAAASSGGSGADPVEPVCGVRESRQTAARRVGRGGEISARDEGVDQKLEAGRGADSVLPQLRRLAMHHGLCPDGVPPSEEQRGPRQRVDRRERVVPVEERQHAVSELELSLPDAEVGHARDCSGVQGRTRLLRHPGCVRELLFSLGPPAGGDEHASVDRAALGVQERAPVALDEVVGDLAPLCGSFQVRSRDRTR